MPTQIPNLNNAGVKMIKIAKVDQDGVDRSDILSTLQSLTINSNSVPVTYIIASILDLGNYFLYLTAVNSTELNGISSFVYFSHNTPGFIASDYDVTYGVADFPQFSSTFMDVNYGWEGGINTPLNFGLILNGTAERAAVQDSNYDSLAWSNIRYNGSRVSSRDFNVPF